MFTILGADGKEYGPVPADKVHEWIRGGRANLQTKARRADETEWKTLGDFPEFTATSVAPAATMATAAPPVPAASVGTPLASRWARLGAQIIDGLIGFFCALPGLGLLFAAGAFSHPDAPNPGLLIAGVVTICALVLALVIFQIYLLSTRGQTLGKKALNIRIVNFDDEGNPGFVKAFLLRAFVNGVIGAVPVIGPLYSLVDLCFIFREDKRCIHDLIASTKVVVA